MSRSRCHRCGHPGRSRRVVTATSKRAKGKPLDARQHKKACSCQCHRPPPARQRHAWPSWVDDSIEFEEAS